MELVGRAFLATNVVPGAETVPAWIRLKGNSSWFSAVASNPNAVSSLFVDNGFASAVTTMADSYTLSGTGVFAAKTQSLTDRHSVLQTQIDRINRSADDLQERLEKQFNALEQAMSSLTSQSSQLLAMLR